MGVDADPALRVAPDNLEHRTRHHGDLALPIREIRIRNPEDIFRVKHCTCRIVRTTIYI